MSDLFSEAFGDPETPTPQMDKATRYRRVARFTRQKVLAVALVVVGAVALYNVTTGQVRPFLAEVFKPKETAAVLDYAGEGTGSIMVKIPTGSTSGDMGRILTVRGVVQSKQAFVDAYNANPNAMRIQAGTYMLPVEMKASFAVAALLDPGTKVQYRFTIIEGRRADEVYRTIAEATGYTLSEIREAAADTVAIGLPPEANGNVEGWLFPDTYLVDPDWTPTEILSRMTSEAVTIMEDTGTPVEKWQDTMILASIIEKESGPEEYMGRVSRVFHNRLEQNWKLGSDATVSYGAAEFDTAEPSREALDNQTNPYNTYFIDGLPPGPICNPSRAAIAAAVSPTGEERNDPENPETITFTGQEMYFVTVDPYNQLTKFATTGEEFNQLVNEYNAWKGEHPEYH